MVETLIILALAVIFFVDGRIRSDLVALCALILLMLFRILSPEEGLSGFSNSIVLMMIGLFVVGGGIFQTGLAKIISQKILNLAGNSETKLFILIVLATSAIGAFVSNTGTVALMLPIVVSLANAANMSPRRFLMPLAFASSMGGMMTLIGTPPNLVISGVLEDAGYGSLSFFSFLPLGLICVTLGLVALGPLSKLLVKGDNRKDAKKGEGKSLKDLANQFQLAKNLYRVRIKPDSGLGNKKIKDLNITQKYNISIMEIRRRTNDKKPFAKTVNQKIAGPDTVIWNNDILYTHGLFENVSAFVKENHLEWVDMHETEDSAPKFSGQLRFDEIGIAEVVIMSNSNLVNRKVKDSGFREKYNINILGIERGNQYLLQNIKDEKIHAGDSLLVQGEWSNIGLLNDDQTEWVVVGQPMAEALKVTLDHKAPLAAIIMVAMIICMAFNVIPSVIAVLLAASLMVLTGCLRNMEAAYKTINWESVVLIAAMLPVSLALEKTGVSVMISDSLASNLGSYGPMALLAGIYFATSLLTMFISNTATAVLFAPIALNSALSMGLSPLPFLFAVTVAASMCFASPFSTPPNALVMSAGRYTFKDYVKVGLPLQILYGVVMVLILPLLFSFY